MSKKTYCDSCGKETDSGLYMSIVGFDDNAESEEKCELICALSASKRK